MPTTTNLRSSTIVVLDSNAAAVAASGITASCGHLTHTINIIGRRFRNPLRFWLALLMATLVAATAPIPNSLLKSLMLGTSAVASFGTSMTAKGLDDPDNPRGAQHVKMALRIGSSACLAVFFAGYTLWFLRGTHQKKRAFVFSGGGCALVLWLVFARPSPASGDGERDSFVWMDSLNLVGLFAVITGILNAESSLVGAICSKGHTVDDEERTSTELTPLHHPNDEENVTLLRRPDNEESGALAIPLGASSSAAPSDRLSSLMVVLVNNLFGSST